MSDNIHKIQFRGGFSDRNKCQKFNTTIQLNNLDNRTRTAISNMVRFWVKSLSTNSNGARDIFYRSVIGEVYCEYLSDEIIYNINFNEADVFDTYIGDPIFNNKYYDVLTLLEYITNWFCGYEIERRRNYFDYGEPLYGYREKANDLFEKEYVGYRFINGIIAPISDEIEVKEIEDAFTIQYNGARSHLEKALGFLSDREKPDYKNSIKESISAVESICKIIVGKDKAQLGEALKILESKNGLKGQLKSGFEKLYNYTNDKGGIRHAEGLFESNVSFEEAKFMLVSCCAFINYLISEYGKTK
ncbi:MAG: hypothetical protein VZQ61_03370 [Christensenellaceae bacterium]